jgi:hypothetical protein
VCDADRHVLGSSWKCASRPAEACKSPGPVGRMWAGDIGFSADRWWPGRNSSGLPAPERNISYHRRATQIQHILWPRICAPGGASLLGRQRGGGAVWP